MANTYQTVLESRSGCGGDVVTFRFRRPDRYEFRAGQWFRLTLETAEGPETKTFSHASAPQDDWIELTTRLSNSAFKRALDELVPGGTAVIGGSGGRLAIPKGARRIAFLVGGVGITPIHSVLRDAAASGAVFDDAVLIYGNRSPDCAPYLEDFLGMRDVGLRVVEVYEKADPGWSGETGFITAAKVRRYIDPWDARPFMVAGPPPMVAAMQRLLDELNVADDSRIIEWFGRPE